MDGDSINEVRIIGEIADGAGEEAASGSPFNKMGIAEPSYGNSSPHERLVSENWKWRGWKSGCDGLVKPPRKDCQVTFGVDQQDPTRSLYGYWVQVPPMDLDWQSPLVGVGHNVSSRSNGYPVAPTMHQEAGAVTDWSCEPYDMRLHNIDALLPGQHGTCGSTSSAQLTRPMQYSKAQRRAVDRLARPLPSLSSANRGCYIIRVRVGAYPYAGPETAGVCSRFTAI